MSKVRILVGTRKGGFILTSDDDRKKWSVEGPLFSGWELFHIVSSPVNPMRLYAAQSTGWFGQVIQRSDDGGKTWEPVSNEFKYEGDPGTHQDFSGNQQPWAFKKVWYLAPSPHDPDLVYAGVEDAAIFRSSDGGKSWKELPGLRNAKGHLWQPGAGGLCLHKILIDPNNPDRIFTAISAAGVFRTDNGGESWKPVTNGLVSLYEIPEEQAEVGHCVHNITMHPSRPEVLFMQKHWDVMRTDNAGEEWTEISGNLPSDFGFPIVVHPHEPETIYVVPIKSDAEHYPPEGKLRVYRSRSGGNEWEALTNGLPQENCYVNILRTAMSVDTLDPAGIYFGTTGGQVYASADSGDSWTAIVRDLPAVMSIEAQYLP